MEHTYAQALERLLESGMTEEEAGTKLIAHLKESGRTKMLPQLARELARSQKQKETRKAVLEVASEKEVAKAKKEAGSQAEARINPDLVSGWRLTTADTLTDRSGKRALIDLYRRITH